MAMKDTENVLSYLKGTCAIDLSEAREIFNDSARKCPKPGYAPKVDLDHMVPLQWKSDNIVRNL